jgi:hypothetical protein
MKHDDQIVQDVKELENLVKPYFGKPRGDELPQTPSEADIIVDLVNCRTHEKTDLIEAKLNNQITQ